jgi:hypothetical protein
MSDEFDNLNIDDECFCEENEDADVFNNDDLFQNQIARRDIVQLKNNIIRKGSVPLEKIFDDNDVARNPKITVLTIKITTRNFARKVLLKPYYLNYANNIILVGGTHL